MMLSGHDPDIFSCSYVNRSGLAGSALAGVSEQ